MRIECQWCQQCRPVGRGSCHSSGLAVDRPRSVVLRPLTPGVLTLLCAHAQEAEEPGRHASALCSWLCGTQPGKKRRNEIPCRACATDRGWKGALPPGIAPRRREAECGTRAPLSPRRRLCADVRSRDCCTTDRLQTIQGARPPPSRPDASPLTACHGPRAHGRCPRPWHARRVTPHRCACARGPQKGVQKEKGIVALQPGDMRHSQQSSKSPGHMMHRRSAMEPSLAPPRATDGSNKDDTAHH